MSTTIRDGKSVWWLYQGRRVLTMAAGGGAEVIRIRIGMPAGTVGKLVQGVVVGPASAAATLTVYSVDEDGASNASFIAIAAGASRVCNLPQPGGGAATHNASASSEGLILGPGQYLLFNGSAAANAETLTVGITMLMSTPTEPTWDSTGSGGTPTLAASTISAANSLQAVVL